MKIEIKIHYLEDIVERGPDSPSLSFPSQLAGLVADEVILQCWDDSPVVVG